VNGSTATRNMLFTLHQEDGRTTTTFKWAETKAMGYHELDTTRSSSAAMVRGEGAAVVVEQRHGSGEIDADLGFVNPTYCRTWRRGPQRGPCREKALCSGDQR